jgi:hypothetical protein
MSQNNDFQVNDFCWAKIKGFPTWPSFILEKKNSRFKVQFLGDNNYSTLQKQKLTIWNKENTDLFLSQSKKYKDLFEGAIFFKELIGKNKLSLSDYSDVYKYCYEKEGKWNKENIQSFIVQNKENNFVFNSVDIDGKRTPKIVIKCNDDDDNINIKSEKKNIEVNEDDKNEDDKNNEDKNISIEKSLRKNNLKNYNNNKKEKKVNENSYQKQVTKNNNNKRQKKNNNNKASNNNNQNINNNVEKKNNHFLNQKRYRITKSNNFSIIDCKKKKQNIKENEKFLINEFIRIGKILFNKK